MNDQMKASLEVILGKDMAQIIAETQAIAGYELPAEARTGFALFHRFVSGTPAPNYISTWRSRKETEHWYHRHVNGILGNVQSAVACAYYHKDRMAQIERELLGAIESVDYRSKLGNATFAIGNTLKWDFEYRSFVLATRSALDYLRRSLSAYFHDKSHSYNSWPRALRSAKQGNVAGALLTIYEAQKERLVYLREDRDGVSIRDRIAHHGHTSPATINLTAAGLFLVGGPERLRVDRQGTVCSLQSIIEWHLKCLVNAINAFLEVFVAEAGKVSLAPDAGGTEKAVV